MNDIGPLTRFTAQHWHEMAAAQARIFWGIVAGRDVNALSQRDIERMEIATDACIYCTRKADVARASAEPAEVEDIIARMADRISSLRAEIALPLLERIRAAHKCRGVVELAAGLGTAILAKPKRVSALFNSPADSDRIDHHMWAWPLTDIRPFAEPVPMRGAQGFWEWPGTIREAA